MLVLGVDPGTAITGYGLLEEKDKKLSVLAYGCIRTDSKTPMTDRLKKIYKEILGVMDEFGPHIVAVEELFFNTNSRTAIAVGQARGTILLAVANSNLKLVEYTPLQVKQAVVGYGRAEKEQVQYMVKTILKLKETPKPDDVADALAIAVCCIQSNEWENLVLEGEKM